MMIFCHRGERNVTFQSPMVRVLSRITFAEKCLFLPVISLMEENDEGRNVTHEIRITGIVEVVKRGNLKIPSFHIFSSITPSESRIGSCHPSLPPEGGVTPPPSSGSGATFTRRYRSVATSGRLYGSGTTTIISSFCFGYDLVESSKKRQSFRYEESHIDSGYVHHQVIVE